MKVTIKSIESVTIYSSNLFNIFLSFITLSSFSIFMSLAIFNNLSNYGAFAMLADRPS